jgi:hypothetical protein
MIAPVIVPWVADLVRWVNALGALALIAAACFAVRWSEHADQRIRFALFAAFGALLTTGHLAALGMPGSYRLPVLTATVALAVWSTIKYVMRERGEHRDE